MARFMLNRNHFYSRLWVTKMSSSKKILGAGLCLAACLFAQGTWAAPTSISQAAFSGAETVIDFNSIADTQSITNQYSAQGVTFSGALVGMTNPGDTNIFNGSTIASNWIYAPGPGNTGSSWTAVFGSVQNRVGFLVESNSNDDVTIEAFLGLASLGSVNFPNPNGAPADFIGIEELGGFDRITVTTATNDNGFFAMDNFRFEASNRSQVPEPGSLALLGLGLTGILFARRRSRV